MITNDLITSPSEIINVMKESQDDLSIISLTNVINYLQANYYLPVDYSNTTFGAVAVADSIRSGHSRILQTIMSQPDVQSLLLDYSHIQNEMEDLAEQLDPRYVQETTEYLHQYYHFRLHLLHPVFSPTGWSDVLSRFVYSPDLVLKKAYKEIKEEEGEEEIRDHFQFVQDYLIHQKQTYLHQYSIQQLHAEAKALRLFIQEFYHYFNDDYSVADWVQGLIEVCYQ